MVWLELLLSICHGVETSRMILSSKRMAKGSNTAVKVMVGDLARKGLMTDRIRGAKKHRADFFRNSVPVANVL